MQLSLSKVVWAKTDAGYISNFIQRVSELSIVERTFQQNSSLAEPKIVLSIEVPRPDCLTLKLSKVL